MSNIIPITDKLIGIHEYVHNKKGQSIGVLAAAAAPDGTVMVGWSKANIKAGDRFDKAKGKSIAYRRSFLQRDCAVPQSLFAPYVRFVTRCEGYFKDKSVIG